MQHTLLLADDSLTIQRVIELTFADEDVRVVAVGDGDEAIAALDEAVPDIVLADVGMPGRNGYEVAQHIRDTPHLSHIPVLLLTGAFEPVDQIRAADLGCAGVLAKPFEPQFVIGRVKELLARPRPTPDPLDRPLVPADEAPAPWPSTIQEPTIVHRGVGSAEVDQYFEHLDKAITSRVNEGADAMRPARAASAAREGEPRPASGFARAPTSSDEGPASAHTSASDLGSVRADENETGQAPAARRVDETAARASSSLALADVFATLLTAEQTESGAAAEAPRFVPASSAVTDDVIEEVARRVLERLPERVARETVTNIVTAAAERLVREEIDRIKAKIL